MKAIVATKPGGPEVLSIIETKEPQAQKEEVKIGCKARTHLKLLTVYNGI